MTHIYVGFHDQRNSSRVLKPPGGGTSNIFGNEDERSLISDLVSPQTSSGIETSQYRGSSIQDVLRSEASITTVVTTQQRNSSTDRNDDKSDENTIGADATDASEGNSTIILNESSAKRSIEKYSSCSTIGDILSQEEIQEKEKIKRLNSQRVPPGGYSSGLW